MEHQPFSWKKRIRSFLFAFAGIRYFFYREHNAWLHACAAILVFFLGWMMNLTATEWIFIIFAVALVWISEMLNTAIEKLMDHLSPEHHPAVKIIKDVSAGAVLIAAIAAFITGLIIFIPRLL